MQSRMNRTELEKRVGVHGERMSVVVIAEVCLFDSSFNFNGLIIEKKRSGSPSKRR